MWIISLASPKNCHYDFFGWQTQLAFFGAGLCNVIKSYFIHGYELAHNTGPDCGWIAPNTSSKLSRDCGSGKLWANAVNILHIAFSYPGIDSKSLPLSHVISPWLPKSFILASANTSLGRPQKNSVKHYAIVVQSHQNLSSISFVWVIFIVLPFSPKYTQFCAFKGCQKPIKRRSFQSISQESIDG